MVLFLPSQVQYDRPVVVAALVVPVDCCLCCASVTVFVLLELLLLLPFRSSPWFDGLRTAHTASNDDSAVATPCCFSRTSGTYIRSTDHDALLLLLLLL
jgi:hypothetical protein